jgi:hypothetical protein
VLISQKYLRLSNMCRLHQVISIPKANDEETNGEQIEEEDEEERNEAGDEEIKAESNIRIIVVKIVCGMTREQLIMIIPHLDNLN